MRQVSYACGKTAPQKNLTAIHAAEGVVAGSMAATTVMYVDQEGDTKMQRICPTCVAAKQSPQATTGKRKLGSAASGKGGPGGAKKAASKSRGRAVPPPYYAELSSYFRALESVAEKCGMKEAAHHLQKAKIAMIHAHASRPARPTDIRAFAAVTERDDGERGRSGSCRVVYRV